MPTRRFQLLDSRLLWEVGLPVLVVWVCLLIELFIVIRRQSFAPLTAHFADMHFNFVNQTAVAAAGGALIWVWLLLRSSSSVTLGDDGVQLWFGRWRRASIPWEQFLNWEWCKDFLGRPLAIVIRNADLQAFHIQFGVGRAGTRRQGLIYPNAHYLALLEAMAQYIPHKGSGWNETVYRQADSP